MKLVGPRAKAEEAPKGAGKEKKEKTAKGEEHASAASTTEQVSDPEREESR